MDITWLKTFIIAAKHENYRLAAEELLMTQPAVTKHIQNLEKALHTELFTRNHKRVALNANGAYFLPIASAIVNEYHNGLKHFQHYLDGFIKEIAIGVAPQIANSILPFVLKAFAEKYPNILVTIEVMKSNEIAQAIHTGQIQIGLSKLAPNQPLLVEEMMEEPIVFAIPAFKQQLSTDQLLTAEKILTHEYAPFWAEIESRLRESYPKASFMKVNQTETIKHFIEQGLGVAFLPKSVCSFGMRANTIVTRAIPLIADCHSKTYFISKYVTEESQFLLAQCKKIYSTLGV